jgi:hypothetical protein
MVESIVESSASDVGIKSEKGRVHPGLGVPEG